MWFSKWINSRGRFLPSAENPTKKKDKKLMKKKNHKKIRVWCVWVYWSLLAKFGGVGEVRWFAVSDATFKNESKKEVKIEKEKNLKLYLQNFHLFYFVDLIEKLWH